MIITRYKAHIIGRQRNAFLIGEITGYVNLNWQDDWYEASVWQEVVVPNARLAAPPGYPVVHPFQGMDSRTLIDARLSLEEVAVGDGRMRFTLWGKNLTDADYPVYSINFGTSVGMISENYGDPRTYGIEVAYEY